MSVSRRELLKAQAAAIAAAAAGIAMPAAAQPVAGGVGALEIKWSKAPCRFCGTGCGVMVGVKTADDAEKAYETILANAKKYKADARIDGIQVQQMLAGGT